MSEVPVDDGRITVEIRHCCTYIPDATGTGWVPAPGQGIEIVSAPTVVDVPAVTPFVQIDAGGMLSCTMGNWQGAPSSYGYAWATDAAPNGATGTDYVTSVSDVGKTITCVVTATNEGGSTTAPPSNGVLIVDPAARAAAESSSSEEVVPRSSRRV
jgi:hypothetical protein